MSRIQALQEKIENRSWLGAKWLCQKMTGRGARPADRRRVFVAGAQRSGTNMVMDMLERSWDTAVFHERDPRAFDNYELRDAATIDALIASSPAPVVVFKALCESQKLVRLLERHAPARSVWVYRNYDAVVRSHVKLWTGMPETMRLIASDPSETDVWRGRGMSDDTRAFITENYHSRLSNESACAMFWYMRNVLFFEQGLENADSTLLLSYDQLLRDPAGHARDLFAFLNLEFRSAVHDFVTPAASTSTAGPAIDIDEPIRQVCDHLQARLDQAAEAARRHDRAS